MNSYVNWYRIFNWQYVLFLFQILTVHIDPFLDSATTTSSDSSMFICIIWNPFNICWTATSTDTGYSSDSMHCFCSKFWLYILIHFLTQLQQHHWTQVCSFALFGIHLIFVEQLRQLIPDLQLTVCIVYVANFYCTYWSISWLSYNNIIGLKYVHLHYLESI